MWSHAVACCVHRGARRCSSRRGGRYSSGGVVASIRSTAQMKRSDSSDGEDENRPMRSPYRTWQLARDRDVSNKKIFLISVFYLVIFNQNVRTMSLYGWFSPTNHLNNLAYLNSAPFLTIHCKLRFTSASKFESHAHISVSKQQAFSPRNIFSFSTKLTFTFIHLACDLQMRNTSDSSLSQNERFLDSEILC